VSPVQGISYRSVDKEDSLTYLTAPWFVSNVFTPLAMRFRMGDTETLAVKTRRKGREQRIPVIPVQHGGTQYVVSTRGDSDWVQNVRAAGELELNGRAMRASEVPADERGPIIDEYRKKAGKTVDAYWKKLPEPADHPTFRLERE
jgi:hypothetical protein